MTVGTDTLYVLAVVVSAAALSPALSIVIDKARSATRSRRRP